MTDSKAKKPTFLKTYDKKYVITGFKKGVNIFDSCFFVFNFDIRNSIAE